MIEHPYDISITVIEGISPDDMPPPGTYPVTYLRITEPPPPRYASVISHVVLTRDFEIQYLTPNFFGCVGRPTHHAQPSQVNTQPSREVPVTYRSAGFTVRYSRALPRRGAIDPESSLIATFATGTPMPLLTIVSVCGGRLARAYPDSALVIL